jgi:hypothetical protein
MTGLSSGIYTREYMTDASLLSKKGTVNCNFGIWFNRTPEPSCYRNVVLFCSMRIFNSSPVSLYFFIGEKCTGRERVSSENTAFIKLRVDTIVRFFY